MAYAPTIIEQIAANVLSTLTGLTLSMPDGSTPALVVGRQTVLDSPAHLSAIIQQGPADRIDAAAVMTDEWVQPFAVVVYVMPADRDDPNPDPNPIDTYGNAAFGAIHKALMVDYTRGGLAVNTVVQAPIYFPLVQGEYAGLTFNFDVQYRTRIDDPFTAVG